MDKIEELTIKNNDDEHKIVCIDSCDVTGIQRNEVEESIKNRFSDKRPKIPFFSKVSLCSASKEIKLLGYTVKLKNINIKKGDNQQHDKQRWNTR